MNAAGMIILGAIAVFAFAATMVSKSVGRGECGGRCTGCGKCGRSRPAKRDTQH